MAFNPGGNDPRSMLVTSVIGGGGPQVIVGNFMDSNVAVLYDLSGMGNWGLNAQPFTCDGFPSAITTGDIDNDTLPDFVASTAAGTLDVFFNTAGSPGKFSLANKLRAGMNATGVAAGDFNGDGLVDVAGALDEGSIAVVISIKNRTFKPAVLYPVGKRPRSIAAGDVNADMIIDLAVANSVSNDVSLLIGNGNGTFKAAMSTPTTGIQLSAIVLGDFNADNKVDMAVTGATSDDVHLLYGDGNGGFGGEVVLPVRPVAPIGIAVADFNGDGKLDIATANNVGFNFTVRIGNGDGTFQLVPTIYVGANNNPQGLWPATWTKTAGRTSYFAPIPARRSPSTIAGAI